MRSLKQPRTPQGSDGCSLKPRTFLWAYGTERLRPDALMSRPELARMIWNWRRNRFAVTRRVEDGRRVFKVQVGDVVGTSVVQ